MSELVVLDNPDLELACLVDADTFTPLAVVTAGENRADMLRAFVNATPFDPAILPADVLREVFVSFLESYVPPIEPPEPAAAYDPLEPGPRHDGDEGEALAEAEAHNATTTPEPAPADADVEADESPQTVTVRCWACQGSGTVTYADGEPSQTCGMCQGTGKVEQVPA